MQATSLFSLPATPADADGASCLGLDTRILCSDFTWRPAGDLAIGDELIGFDPVPRVKGAHRKMRIATVTASRRLARSCRRVRFTDGREVVSSAGHLWLSGRRAGGWYAERSRECDTCGGVFKSAQALGAHRRRAHDIAGWWKQQDYGAWIATEQLRPGSKIRDLGVPWTVDTSWESGYLAGVYDGEASLSPSAPRAGWYISFAQLPGSVLTLVEQLVKEKGYRARQATWNAQSGVMHLPISGMYDCFRFLGECRPVRLLAKSPAWIDGRSGYRSGSGVVESVESIGDSDAVMIGSSTMTFFAEGLYSRTPELGSN